MGGHVLSDTWWEHDGGGQQGNETWIEIGTVISDIVRFSVCVPLTISP